MIFGPAVQVHVCSGRTEHYSGRAVSANLIRVAALLGRPPGTTPGPQGAPRVREKPLASHC
ncbi:hypothetical protein GCM10009525_83070 [Streptosporangium amethystogenes subsp. fukuiense]